MAGASFFPSCPSGLGRRATLPPTILPTPTRPKVASESNVEGEPKRSVRYDPEKHGCYRPARCPRPVILGSRCDVAAPPVHGLLTADQAALRSESAARPRVRIHLLTFRARRPAIQSTNDWSVSRQPSAVSFQPEYGLTPRKTFTGKRLHSVFIVGVGGRKPLANG